MIRASDIRDLKDAAIDFKETVQLKTQLQEALLLRNPIFLKLDEFHKILKWKLGNQYYRIYRHIEKNTDEIVGIITGAAFSLRHPDPETEVVLKIKLLCALPGVEIPVASAILALTHPEDYAVIDFRGWRQIFGSRPKYYTPHSYFAYLQEIRAIASKLEWPVQVTDQAIWEYDRRHPIND